MDISFAALVVLVFVILLMIAIFVNCVGDE